MMDTSALWWHSTLSLSRHLAQDGHLLLGATRIGVPLISQVGPLLEVVLHSQAWHTHALVFLGKCARCPLAQPVQLEVIPSFWCLAGEGGFTASAMRTMWR